MPELFTVIASISGLIAVGYGAARSGLLGAGTLAGLPPVFLAACPTGVNPYLIATRLGTGQTLATGAITLSTAAGAGTVALGLLVVRPG